LWMSFTTIPPTSSSTRRAGSCRELRSPRGSSEQQTCLNPSPRLPFVIPSGGWACGPPKWLKNAFRPVTTVHGSVALPFVIPNEAEGSAVPQTIPGNVFRQRSCLPPPKVTKISCSTVAFQVRCGHPPCHEPR
jgi:hypothetical protein